MAAPLAALGSFKITSLLEGNPIVGAAGKESPAHVRLGGSEDVWTPHRVDDTSRAYTLHAGEFTSTQVILDMVFATDKDGEDVKWYFNKDEASDAYIVTVDEEKTKGWTVSSEERDADIMIKDIENPPARTQLFKFEKLD